MEAMDLDIVVIQAKVMLMIDRVINIDTINVDDHVHIHNPHLDETSVTRISW